MPYWACAPSFPACFGQSVAGDFRCPIATSYSDWLAGRYILECPCRLPQWMQQHYCNLYGITEYNFGIWLRNAESYGGSFNFWYRVHGYACRNSSTATAILRYWDCSYWASTLGASKYTPILRQIGCYWKNGDIRFLLGLPFVHSLCLSAVNGHPSGQLHTPPSIRQVSILQVLHMFRHLSPLPAW